MEDNTFSKNISESQFWNEYYINNDTGWDLGGVTPVFKNWCDNLNKKSKILVPGSGNGYDPLYFSSLGHDVLAVDFSEKAIKRIKNEAKKNNLRINVLKGNFFDLDKTFYNLYDYVIEYTFFCAIDPKNRLNYISMVHQILKESGQLIGLFFPLNKKESEGGPPFGVSLKEIEYNFNKKFKLIKSFKHPLSIDARSDNEQYFEFEKIIV